MVQLKNQARVSSRNGWAGTLKRLVVDPGTERVTHLVIEMVSPPGDAIVPIEHVIATGYETVFLDITSVQLEAFCKPGAFEERL